MTVCRPLFSYKRVFFFVFVFTDGFSGGEASVRALARRRARRSQPRARRDRGRHRAASSLRARPSRRLPSPMVRLCLFPNHVKPRMVFFFPLLLFTGHEIVVFLRDSIFFLSWALIDCVIHLFVRSSTV